MGRRGRVLSVLLALVLLALFPAQAGPSLELVLGNVRLLDGRAGQDILIRDGRIQRIGPGLKGSKRVDASGLTALPGFIDCHVHLALTRPEQVLRNGVTTVRDLGWAPGALKQLKGPRVMAAGPILTCRGGYPMQAGWAPRGAAREVTVGTAANVVDQLAADGVAVIKVALEPRAGPVLDQATLATIVLAAHERKLKVTAHVSTLAELDKALSCDVDELAHGLFDDTAIPDEMLQQMKRGGVALVPTLRIGPTAHRIGNVRRFFALGGTVLYGTDLGNYGPRPGIDVSELSLMVQAGMSRQAVIESATGRAADWLGLKDRGRLAPGLWADIVLVKGDPVRDLDCLEKPVKVYLGGVEVR